MAKHMNDMVLISIDDHICEPPDMFDKHLSGEALATAPKLKTDKNGKNYWSYQGKNKPVIGLNAAVGRPLEDYGMEPNTLHDMRDGCYDVHGRINDMNADGIAVQMNFGNSIGFDNSTFHQADDKDLALTHLRAWNDCKRRGTGCVTGEALRTYLKNHDELPEASQVAWYPVNVSKDPEQGAPGANNLSGMSVAIGTGIADPMERLTSIRAATASAKAAESGVGARMITELTQHIPSAGMAGLARLMSNESFAPRFCNLFVSNVPGSPVPQYMAGAKCSHQFGLAPLGNGMGLFIAVGSYNGKLVFNIISDRKILPDMELFRECLQASHLELLEAAKKGKQAKKAKRAKKAPE